MTAIVYRWLLIMLVSLLPHTGVVSASEALSSPLDDYRSLLESISSIDCTLHYQIRLPVSSGSGSGKEAYARTTVNQRQQYIADGPILSLSRFWYRGRGYGKMVLDKTQLTMLMPEQGGPVMLVWHDENKWQYKDYPQGWRSRQRHGALPLYPLEFLMPAKWRDPEMNCLQWSDIKRRPIWDTLLSGLVTRKGSGPNEIVIEKDIAVYDGPTGKLLSETGGLVRMTLRRSDETAGYLLPYRLMGWFNEPYSKDTDLPSREALYFGYQVRNFDDGGIPVLTYLHKGSGEMMKNKYMTIHSLNKLEAEDIERIDPLQAKEIVDMDSGMIIDPIAMDPLALDPAGE